MEASGSYERTAFTLLWSLGLPCGLANPRSVRRFAEAMGYLEKTDRIDAAMIARSDCNQRLCKARPRDGSRRRRRVCPRLPLLVILNATARDARNELAHAA